MSDVQKPTVLLTIADCPALDLIEQACGKDLLLAFVCMDLGGNQVQLKLRVDDLSKSHGFGEVRFSAADDAGTIYSVICNPGQNEGLMRSMG